MGALAIGIASLTYAADLNGDGVVDAADQSVLLASWGDCPAPCPSDLDGDGDVDGADFAILLDAASEASDGTIETVDSDGLYESGSGTDTLEGGDTFETEDPLILPPEEDLAIAVHNVPLPAPVWIGLAGLAGAVIVRRRWFGNYA